jgi:hypothetical protein
MVNIAGFDPPMLCAWSNTGADRDVTKHSAVNQRPLNNVNPSYRRLFRYNEAGLIRLLAGLEVIALAADTGANRWPSGS